VGECLHFIVCSLSCGSNAEMLKYSRKRLSMHNVPTFPEFLHRPSKKVSNIKEALSHEDALQMLYTDPTGKWSFHIPSQVEDMLTFSFFVL
jgi:hypothetical protein